MKNPHSVKLDTVTTRIPAWLNVKLTVEAELTKKTKSEVVRIALENFINSKYNPKGTATC